MTQSSRFFGKWPTDKVGNPLVVKVQPSPYVFKDSIKEALGRIGSVPKPQSAPKS